MVMVQEDQTVLVVDTVHEAEMAVTAAMLEEFVVSKLTGVAFVF